MSLGRTFNEPSSVLEPTRCIKETPSSGPPESLSKQIVKQGQCGSSAGDVAAPDCVLPSAGPRPHVPAVSPPGHAALHACLSRLSQSWVQGLCQRWNQKRQEFQPGHHWPGRKMPQEQLRPQAHAHHPLPAPGLLHMDADCKRDGKGFL